jgi:hypothetical protein
MGTTKTFDGKRQMEILHVGVQTATAYPTDRDEICQVNHGYQLRHVLYQF